MLLSCGGLTAMMTPLYLLDGLPQSIALLGAAVSGFTVAVLVCALAEAFCRLAPRELLSGTTLVFLIAYALVLALTMLVDATPRAAVVALVSLLPACSSVALALMPLDRAAAACDGRSNSEAIACEDARGEGAPRMGELLRGLPWRTFVIIACMYFAIGGMRLYVEQVTGSLAMGPGGLALGIVLLALLVAATQIVGRQRAIASLGMFYKVALPLVIVGYVVLLAADRQATGMLSIIAQLVCLVTECLCWVLIVESARTSGVSALIVIGVGRFVVQLGMSLGELVGLAALGNLLPFGIATVFLLLMAFMFLFSERETSVSLGDGFVADRRPSQASAAADVEPGRLKPSEVATGVPMTAPDAWGLTERERAVLDLWVTSHGLRSIATSLNVSESTVKTHLRHIYEKSGVHNRAELIALIDGMRPGR